jgi:hypothetical protein
LAGRSAGAGDERIDIDLTQAGRLRQTILPATGDQHLVGKRTSVACGQS